MEDYFLLVDFFTCWKPIKSLLSVHLQLPICQYFYVFVKALYSIETQELKKTSIFFLISQIKRPNLLLSRSKELIATIPSHGVTTGLRADCLHQKIQFFYFVSKER